MTQQEHGWLVYPGRGWRKLMFKMPLYLWRLGLARLLPANYLLLSMTGRKSGLPRRTMLEYTSINGHFYLLSGWGQKAQWVQNVLANPLVTIQTVREGSLSGQATTVTDAQEIATLYTHAQGTSPFWGVYLASLGIEDNVQDFVVKKDRLCILRIDPVEAATPPPLTADLTWVWPMCGIMVLLLLRLRSRSNHSLGHGGRAE